ncbi:MAG: hypothetical protein U1E70_15275 [Acetobacteraceae bacterium]
MRGAVVALAMGADGLIGTAAQAYDPTDCMRDVGKVQPTLAVGLATRLCAASWSAEPVKCFLGSAEIDRTITVGISVDLCAGTTDASKTVACYAKAGQAGLNRGLATTLCGARKPEQ